MDRIAIIHVHLVLVFKWGKVDRILEWDRMDSVKCDVLDELGD